MAQLHKAQRNGGGGPCQRSAPVPPSPSDRNSRLSDSLPLPPWSETETLPLPLPPWLPLPSSSESSMTAIRLAAGTGAAGQGLQEGTREQHKCSAVPARADRTCSPGQPQQPALTGCRRALGLLAPLLAAAGGLLADGAAGGLGGAPRGAPALIRAALLLLAAALLALLQEVRDVRLWGPRSGEERGSAGAAMVAGPRLHNTPAQPIPILSSDSGKQGAASSSPP